MKYLKCISFWSHAGFLIKRLKILVELESFKSNARLNVYFSCSERTNVLLAEVKQGHMFLFHMLIENAF